MSAMSRMRQQLMVRLPASLYDVPPSLTSPAVAVASSTGSPRESPNEKLAAHCWNECEPSNLPGVRRLTEDATRCLRSWHDS